MNPQRDGAEFNQHGVKPAPQIDRALAESGALGGRERVRLLVLGLLVLLCALLYYLGEIVDVLNWNAVRWQVLYGVHDVQRLFFLAPVIYAAYTFGMRATIIMTLVASMSMLPRALFVSPYPDPLLRMLLSVVIMGTLGYLVATNRLVTRKNRRLEASMARERDTLLGILERMQDGVVIIGSDYRVRFANRPMVRDFGVSVGGTCYQAMYDLGSPCPEICRMDKVIAGAVERWQYIFPDGRSYEIVASPFMDQDGTTCLLATYRDIFADSATQKGVA